jgi:hypothetical protein
MKPIGSSAVDTRARILDAARTLFAERGYAGTSMRDLADALGMTKAALYYHFPELMADPSAKSDLGGRLDSQGRFDRLERALAGRDGDVLPVRCAIGAAHVGILSTIAARARAGDPPELAGDEIERVIRAGLAAWEAAR